MSIASRITAMTEHIDDIYDTVELTGVDTTGLNKNLVNVPNALKDGFVDIINNGVDTLYENFPKVAQTGEEPTLNGVYEALMRVDLNGNTEQTTYTGKNYAIITPKDISQYGLTINYDTNTGKISIKGKANTTAGIGVANSSDLNIPSGEYTLSINKALPFLINYVVTDTQNTNRAFRIPAGSTNVTVSVPYNGISTALFIAIENNVDYDLEFYLQLESGSTVTDFEPYVGGSPSPSPDYPQDIRVVKGDNTIKATGKNLIEGSQDFSGVWNNSQKWETDTNSYNDLIVKKNQGTWNGINKEIYITAGTYTFSIYAKSDSERTAFIYLGGTLTSDNLVPQSKQLNLTTEWQRYDVTFTSNASGAIKPRLENPTYISNNYTYVCGYQLQQGNLTEYQPYQEQTYPINLKSKNLLPFPYTEDNKTMNGVTFTVQPDGSVLVNGTATAQANIKLFGLQYQDTQKEFPAKYLYGGTNSVRLRALNNTNENFVVLATDTGNGAEIDMSTYNKGYIELTVPNGTTVDNQLIKPMVLDSLDDTTYEPYYNYELCEIDDYKDYIYKENDKWYLKKNIGKVAVDTSNITLKSNYTNIEYAEIPKPNDFIGKGNYEDYNVYCSHAVSDIKNAAQHAWDSTYRIGKITNKANVNNFWLGFPKDTGLDNIKTALNGAVIYYVLATPTTEEITDTTLIEQLEDLKTAKSVEGQTNITQVNEELPFILDVSGLKKD